MILQLFLFIKQWTLLSIHLVWLCILFFNWHKTTQNFGFEWNENLNDMRKTTQNKKKWNSWYLRDHKISLKYYNKTRHRSTASEINNNKTNKWYVIKLKATYNQNGKSQQQQWWQIAHTVTHKKFDFQNCNRLQAEYDQIHLAILYLHADFEGEEAKVKRFYRLPKWKKHFLCCCNFC